MRTKSETIELCKEFFPLTDNARVVMRLCPENDVKRKFFRWLRKKQSNEDGEMCDASDYMEEGDEFDFGENVEKVGPDSAGYFYFVDRETNEVVKRVHKRKLDEGSRKETQVDESIWYAVMESISFRFHKLIKMSDRLLLQEEISGISSRAAENNMRIFFAILSVLGFLDKETVYSILNARTTTSQSEEKRELFISTLFDIPFGIRKTLNTNVLSVRKTLDERLYKLDEVKEQILDYIAIMIHSKMQGMPVPILLVGPPGVGKTSIAKAVASALYLQFYSFHLGGASDNAVFKGHHSSWSDSTPGGIIRMLTSVECENPIVLFDEIDKAGASQHGVIQDIISELLDPAQSSCFRDNYMGFPVDLSRCLYILTANDKTRIPDYLLDRCEVITIPEYTNVERAYIIANYLVQQVCDENVLSCNVKLDAEVVEKLSHLRSLRESKRIIRSGIARVLSKLNVGEADNIRITLKDIVLKSHVNKSAIGFRPVAKHQ